MKLPRTPRRAYFSMKKNFGASGSIWASVSCWLPSELKFEATEAELRREGAVGFGVVGEELLEPLVLWLPLPLVLFD